jgi:hypothetical protein
MEILVPKNSRISKWQERESSRDVSRTRDDTRGLQQANRVLDRGRTEVHVLLRRREIAMAGEFLIALVSALRIARCEQNV